MCTAVLQQELNQSVQGLPDSSVRLLIEVAKSMKPAMGADEISDSSKADAFEAMERLRAASPFPKDIDFDAIREEAIKEKYANLA